MRRYKKTLICWTIWISILFIGWMFVLKESKLTPISYSEQALPHRTSGNVKLKNSENRYLKYRQSENQRKGAGEHGVPVKLRGPEAMEVSKVMETEAFNVKASDRIALDRALPDIRNHRCQSLRYSQDLPTTSVVIIFHNEAWSTLLRTVHSVINRSPPEYLHEVILVDDFSDKDFLKSKLEEYITQTWPEGVVHLIRNTERQGLIRSKVVGAKSASGDVLVFLDAHCEVNRGWLEPLLSRIKEDRTTVVCPRIHPIDARTLEYPPMGNLHTVGGFWWSLHFKWIPIPEKDTKGKDEAQPVRSPTMAGGIFAMERKYFFQIGAYDMGMDVWGGENLEMSFRIWMCGGSLEIHPCSIVGHIFRRKHPYTFPGNKDTHGINSARLAEVWMDDYKKLFYMHRKGLLNADYGDISERLQLRRLLKCQSFKWYLDNVYPQKFIPDENVVAYGTLRVADTHLCLDTLQGDEEFVPSLGVYWCQEDEVNPNQLFSQTHNNTIRHEEVCMYITLPAYPNYHVQGKICEDTHNMIWIHDKINGTILNSASGYCLDAWQAKSGDRVLARTCDGSPTQRWTFQHYVN